MSLITLKSSSKVALVYMMTRTLNLNLVDVVAIRMEPLVHVQITVHKSIEESPSRDLHLKQLDENSL